MAPIIASSVLCFCLSAAVAWDTCTTFKDIYPSGKELCEKMWGDSFEYNTTEDSSYTMWFFNENANPNNHVAALLGKDPTPDTCKLQYYHKSGGGQEAGGYHTGVYAPPSAEGDAFTECHPWKQSSCCHEAVVTTPKAINEAYGDGYHWNRCDGWVDGYKMSEACERFFVQEACMYECDPHSGEYRRYTDGQADAFIAWVEAGNPGDYAMPEASDPVYSGTFEHAGISYPKSVFRGNGVYGPNKWQMYKMPIKASYCDAFYNACRNDYFCGEGDFWACSADYKAAESERVAAREVAALSAALANFPTAIQTQVRNMTDVTSATAAAVAQGLLDTAAASERAVNEAKKDVPDWGIVLIIMFGVIALLVIVFVAYIVKLEKRGKPMFMSLSDIPAKQTTSKSSPHVPTASAASDHA